MPQVSTRRLSRRRSTATMRPGRVSTAGAPRSGGNRVILDVSRRSLSLRPAQYRWWCWARPGGFEEVARGGKLPLVADVGQDCADEADHGRLVGKMPTTRAGA